MQAGGTESAPMSEDPSSDSEEECEVAEEPSPDAALTEEWAVELLTTSAGVVGPSEVQVESRRGVVGALSRILSVTIRYQLHGDTHELPLVVKLPPRDPFGRLFVAEAQFDTREIMFYMELAPILNLLAEERLGPDPRNMMHVPRMVKARLPDNHGGDSELILEDVSVYGFEAADFAEGLTENQARAALHAAARLHALSLALRDAEGPLDQRFDYLFPCERAAAGYLRLVRRSLPQLESFLRGRPGCAEEAAAVSALCARAPSLLGTILRPTEPAPLAHADFWSGNLFFRENEGVTECLVLDWQMVSLGRPMDDIALLMLSSLTPEMRRSIGDLLIEDYADRLESECIRLGVGPVGAIVRRSLLPDWPRAALRALLLCAGSVDVALGDPRAERRLLEAVRDLHAQGVLALQPDTES